jgi:hypothetical protein
LIFGAEQPLSEPLVSFAESLLNVRYSDKQQAAKALASGRTVKSRPRDQSYVHLLPGQMNERPPDLYKKFVAIGSIYYGQSRRVSVVVFDICNGSKCRHSLSFVHDNSNLIFRFGPKSTIEY